MGQGPHQCAVEQGQHPPGLVVGGGQQAAHAGAQTPDALGRLIDGADSQVGHVVAHPGAHEAAAEDRGARRRPGQGPPARHDALHGRVVDPPQRGAHEDAAVEDIDRAGGHERLDRDRLHGRVVGADCGAPQARTRHKAAGQRILDGVEHVLHPGAAPARPRPGRVRAARAAHGADDGVGPGGRQPRGHGLVGSGDDDVAGVQDREQGRPGGAHGGGNVRRGHEAHTAVAHRQAPQRGHRGRLGVDRVPAPGRLHNGEHLKVPHRLVEDGADRPVDILCGERGGERGGGAPAAGAETSVDRDDDAERGAAQMPRGTRVAHGRAGVLRDVSRTLTGTATGIGAAETEALASIYVRIPRPSSSPPFLDPLRVLRPPVPPEAFRTLQGEHGRRGAGGTGHCAGTTVRPHLSAGELPASSRKAARKGSMRN